MKPAMKRGVITVANERFRIGADQRLIEIRQQLRRPPTAACADDAINRRISKSCMQIVQTVFDRAGIVKRTAIEGMFTENSLVAKRVQMSHSSMHQLDLWCTRR